MNTSTALQMKKRERNLKVIRIYVKEAIAKFPDPTEIVLEADKKICTAFGELLKAEIFLEILVSLVLKKLFLKD